MSTFQTRLGLIMVMILMIVTMGIWSPLHAQTVVHKDKANGLSWSWSPEPSSGPVANYQVGCGTVSGGPYTDHTLLLANTVITTSLGAVIAPAGIPGTYFCVVDVLNSAGSVRSNEVHVSVVAESPPVGTATLVVNP